MLVSEGLVVGDSWIVSCSPLIVFWNSARLTCTRLSNHCDFRPSSQASFSSSSKLVKVDERTLAPPAR